MAHIDGYVYMIRLKGHTVYKIGSTVDLEKRIQTIQRRFDIELEYVAYAYVKGYVSCEDSWHKKFIRFRVGKEFFALTDEQVQVFIDWSKLQ